MAVRTGPPGSGASGISLLLVPLKDHPGVTMRRLSVSGLASSGTTYIELDDVRVPIENLIGLENHGMRYIMTNFDHERLAVATGATRQARVALSAAFEYVMKREAFGKPLIEQPVVRHRLAKAGALLESLTAWVERFAFMMTKLPPRQADIILGGPTALLKAQAGMVFKECADTAVLSFGGNGYTKTRQGELIESESHPPSSEAMVLFANHSLQCFNETSWEQESPVDPRTSCSISLYASLSRYTRRKPRCCRLPKRQICRVSGLRKSGVQWRVCCSILLPVLDTHGNASRISVQVTGHCQLSHG
jgi:hypothetical protein